MLLFGKYVVYQAKTMNEWLDRVNMVQEKEDKNLELSLIATLFPRLPSGMLGFVEAATTTGVCLWPRSCNYCIGCLQLVISSIPTSRSHNQQEHEWVGG